MLCIANDPTTVAIGYSLDKKGDKKNVPIFKVKAAAGDTHLGREDFNIHMADYFLQDFKCHQCKDMSKIQ
eukprot:9446608-Ditylum_brightwellii.AAC.1